MHRRSPAPRAALLLAALSVGCYRPEIEDGFACPGGADDECPDGFTCCPGDECRRSCEGEGEAEGEGEGEGECVDACPPPGTAVCGDDGTSYASACVASCLGVGVACEGPCPCQANCACDQPYDPVCGNDGATYANLCETSCLGVGVACAGECPCEAGCACGEGAADEVCGSDGVTHSSACQADCLGVAIECGGPCPCEREGESEAEAEIEPECPSGCEPQNCGCLCDPCPAECGDASTAECWCQCPAGEVPNGDGTCEPLDCWGCVDGYDSFFECTAVLLDCAPGCFPECGTDWWSAGECATAACGGALPPACVDALDEVAPCLAENECRPTSVGLP